MSPQPIRILQWGMTTGLGGIETFIMNLYRHMDQPRCSLISCKVITMVHCILRMRSNPWEEPYIAFSCRSGIP